MSPASDQIRFWHDAMGSVPLLAKEEMIRLGLLIQDPSTPEHKRKKAIDKLVVHNMRLIPAVVRRTLSSKRTHRYGDTFSEDLLQVAVLGLYRAAAKYNPSLGYAFSTYAMMWIYQAVSREVSCNYGLIRVPENTVRDFYNAVKKERNLMFPDKDPKVRERLQDAYFALNCLSIEQLSANMDDDCDVYSILGSTDEQMSRSNDFEELLDVGALTKKQRTVLTMIYERSMNHAEISRETGLSRDTVKRLHDVSLRKLKKAMSR